MRRVTLDGFNALNNDGSAVIEDLDLKGVDKSVLETSLPDKFRDKRIITRFYYHDTAKAKKLAKKEAKAALGSLIPATALQPVQKSEISVDPIVKSQFFRVSPNKDAKGQWAAIADSKLPHTRYLGSDNNDLSDPSVFRRLRKLLNDVGPASMVYLDLPAFVDEGTDDSSILNSAQQRTLDRDRWTLYCQRLSILVKGVRKKGVISLSLVPEEAVHGDVRNFKT